MNGYDFRTKLAEIAPDYAIDKDNYGQLIIYTNLMEIDNDEYVNWIDTSEMTDEEIEEMDKQLAEEQESLPENMQGPVMGQAPDQGNEQAEPEDNTVDETEDQESLTPGLDDEVNKSVVSINKKRK